MNSYAKKEVPLLFDFDVVIANLNVRLSIWQCGIRGVAATNIAMDADEWRSECWQMIRGRSDLHFLFLTKRIERFMDCIPKAWNDGYDNVALPSLFFVQG